MVEDQEDFEEVLNMSYSNLRVYEDQDTLCFLGNNPMLSECDTADRSAAFLALSNSTDSYDITDPNFQSELKYSVNFEMESRRKKFYVTQKSLSSSSAPEENDENTHPNRMDGKFYGNNVGKGSERQNIRMKPAKGNYPLPDNTNGKFSQWAMPSRKNDRGKEFHVLNIYEDKDIVDSLPKHRINVVPESSKLAGKPLKSLSPTKKPSDLSIQPDRHRFNRINESISLISTVLKANIADVRSHSCNSTSFVLRSSESSLIITDALQNVFTRTNYSVVHNKMFEWVRGVSMSGYAILLLALSRPDTFT